MLVLPEGESKIQKCLQLVLPEGESKENDKYSRPSFTQSHWNQSFYFELSEILAKMCRYKKVM